MAEMTSRERAVCPERRNSRPRALCGNGDRFPFISKLLGLDIAPGRFFESGEYESAPLDIQMRVNEILHRDNLVYSMLPPIPAVKVPGRDGILFFEAGKIRSWSDLDQLQFPDLTSEEVLAPMRRFRAHSGDYATICSCRVGISATYLAMGMEHFYYALVDKPALVEELMRRYTDYAAGVVEQAAKLGFDIFWTADDIAARTATLFSPQMFRELMLPHMRKVAERVHDTGIHWIYHSDGNLSAVIDDLLALGIRGLNPIEPTCMDIRQLKQQYGSRMVLSGNVDVHLLAEGPPAAVRETTMGLLRDVAPGGGYMLASGNSVASFCNVECVKAMCDANYEHGRYPICV
ncbi:MAG: uroporphyrinogen decarboxylase family protein [Caldilineaceae bacterium]